MVSVFAIERLVNLVKMAVPEVAFGSEQACNASTWIESLKEVAVSGMVFVYLADGCIDDGVSSNVFKGACFIDEMPKYMVECFVKDEAEQVGWCLNIVLNESRIITEGTILIDGSGLD